MKLNSRGILSYSLLCGLFVCGAHTYGFSQNQPLRLANPDSRCALNSAWQCLMAALPVLSDLLPKDEATFQERLVLLEQYQQEWLSKGERNGIYWEKLTPAALRTIWLEIERYRAHQTTDQENRTVYTLSSELNAWYRAIPQGWFSATLLIALTVLCGKGKEAPITQILYATLINKTTEDQPSLHPENPPASSQAPILLVVDMPTHAFPHKRPIVPSTLCVQYADKQLFYTLVGVDNHDYSIIWPRLYTPYIRYLLRNYAEPAILRFFLRGSTHADAYVRYQDQFFYCNDQVVVAPEMVQLNQLGEPQSQKPATGAILAKLLPGEPRFVWYMLTTTTEHHIENASDNDALDAYGLILPADAYGFPSGNKYKSYLFAVLFAGAACSNFKDAIGYFSSSAHANISLQRKALKIAVGGLSLCLSIYFAHYLKILCSYTYTRLLTTEKLHPLSMRSAGTSLRLALWKQKIGSLFKRFLSLFKDPVSPEAIANATPDRPY